MTFSDFEIVYAYVTDVCHKTFVYLFFIDFILCNMFQRYISLSSDSAVRMLISQLNLVLPFLVRRVRWEDFIEIYSKLWLKNNLHTNQLN